MQRSKTKGFSLVEIVVSTLLVGAVLGMVMGAVVMLDRAVANEKIVQLKFVPTQRANWGYDSNNVGVDSSSNNVVNFSVAPSRACDAKAQALWREMQTLYEQSLSVGVINKYIIQDFTSAQFVGQQGFLTSGTNSPLTNTELQDPSTAAGNDSLFNVLAGPGGRFIGTFKYWGQDPLALPANIDPNSLRQATVFFLAAQDRLLGILRMRAWQFTTADPYRYYEVGLTRYIWDSTGANLQSLIEDRYYRFVEDKRFPQNLIFPPTDVQLNQLAGGDTSGIQTQLTSGTVNNSARNVFVRLSLPGEDPRLKLLDGTVGTWSTNMNPCVSRYQVSLAQDYTNLTNFPLQTAVPEWHIILPDPSLSQGEDRANLRLQSNFDATIGSASYNLDKAFRRQGKYGCALSVHP